MTTTPIGTFYYSRAEPLVVYRQRREEAALYLERWAPTSNEWVDASDTLSRFLFNGEIGLEPVTDDEARRLIETLKSPP